MANDPNTAAKAPARPSVGNPITKSHSVWKGGMLFESGSMDGTRTHLVDGQSKQAPSPVEALLGSVGTCSGSDVVDILAKQRTPATRLEIDVVALRRADFPRRVQQLEVTFTIEGDGITREQAERAIALSIEKYCTVAASLAGDIAFTSIVVLNGSRGEPVQQPMFSSRLAD
jgi:putative redox protein